MTDKEIKELEIRLAELMGFDIVLWKLFRPTTDRNALLRVHEHLIEKGLWFFFYDAWEDEALKRVDEDFPEAAMMGQEFIQDPIGQVKAAIEVLEKEQG
jgi:hypothetical protein